MPLLLRALSSCPEGEHTHIICNTLDDEFTTELDRSELARHYQIYHTESDGYPGLGHQSCLDHFLKTDYTHLIKLDGDDEFFSGGHKQIRQKIQDNPDVNVLSLLGCELHTRTGVYPAINVKTHWNKVDLRSYITSQGYELTVDLADWMFDFSGYTGDDDYWFERMVCVDKKGAAIEKYNSLKCSTEDVQLLMKMKLAHHRGDIVYRHFESPTCYKYNKVDGNGASDSLFADPAAWRQEMEEPFTVEELELISKIRIPKI